MKNFNIKKRDIFIGVAISLLAHEGAYAYDIYYNSMNPKIKVGIASDTTLGNLSSACGNKRWEGYQGSPKTPVIAYSGGCSGATWKHIYFYVTNSKGQNKEIYIPGIAATAGDIYLFIQEDAKVRGNYILYRCANMVGVSNATCDRTRDYTVVASIVPAEYQ